MNERLNQHSGVLALLALALALVAAVGGIASAAGVFVTTRDIKNGTILSQDIHNNQVKSADVKNGTVASGDIKTGGVTSPDIGTGQVGSEDIGEGEVHTGDIGGNQVTPSDVNLPESEQIVEPPKDVASAEVGPDFALIDSAGAYTKEAAESVLEVTWTGTAKAEFGAGLGSSKCVFQLRVDGNAAAGAGEAFVENSSINASVTALFAGLGVGPHNIEVWAKSAESGTAKCIVGPAEIGIGQTFTIAEQVS